MLVERLVLKEDGGERIYVLAEWSIVVEGHWSGNEFLRHKKLGARESCCEKLGRPEQLCIIPVLSIGAKRVKMLYLSRAEYDTLLELMDNIDVKASPVKVTKKKDAPGKSFLWCSDEENGMHIRDSVSAFIGLLQKEDFIDKITWPGIKYNDIAG